MKTLEELVDELALGDEVGRVGHLFTMPRDIFIPRFSDFPVVNIHIGDVDIGVLLENPTLSISLYLMPGRALRWREPSSRP